MKSRKSGILLHVTSLPSDFGIGDLGRGAYVFADFLAASQQTIWQVLPFNPTSPACGNSPYYSYSAFAGNPMLIGLEPLEREGYLSGADLGRPPSGSPDRVAYGPASQWKREVLATVFEKFQGASRRESGYADFLDANAYWLDDYALFVCLREHFGGAAWNEWPPELRDRNPRALEEFGHRLAGGVEREKFYQYLFFKQWIALKSYCNRKNIQILGDIPIYVSYDSADVWANPEYFKLDGEKRPLFVGGVPPDYFSDTGQLWGNPVYAWDRLGESSYGWWVRRFAHNLRYFDMVRLDHFRGFVAYWEVPASEETAVNGKWVKAPARALFNTLLKRFPFLPMIAEDLGIITPDVREIMNGFGFPGMKLLLFAFGDDPATNPYIPHNHVKNCVVYTGTHDNNTTRGWFEQDATDWEKENLLRYLGRGIDGTSVSWELVRVAMMSVAGAVVIPMQDFLDLGAEARMNTPATPFGNWEWRVAGEQLAGPVAERISGMTRLYGRS